MMLSRCYLGATFFATLAFFQTGWQLFGPKQSIPESPVREHR